MLIGAAVNAAFDTVFPQKATTRARLELVQRCAQRIEPARTARLAGRVHGSAAVADYIRTCPTTRATRRRPRLGTVALPERARSPVVGAGPAAAGGLGILVGTVLLVYFDRDGYSDANDPTGDGRASSTRSTTRPSP